MNKAMCLTVESSEEEELRIGLKNDLDAAEKHIVTKLGQVQADIGETLEKIVYSLKTATGQVTAVPPTGGSMSSQSSQEFDLPLDTAVTHAKMSRQDSRAKTSRKFSNDNSVMSEVSVEEDDINTRKKINLDIMKITELNVPIEDANSIFCKVICETGSHNVTALHVSSGEITFNPNNITVCERASRNDGRSCRIEVIQMDPNTNQNKILSTVELHYSELIHRNGQHISRPIAHSSSHDSEITFAITCQNAMMNDDDVSNCS
jgi:hypothetical protein